VLRGSIGKVLDESYSAEVRRDVPLITLARTAANALYRFAPVVLAAIAAGLDVSIGELGVALTIAELCGLAAPLLGRFVDRVPRRWSMVLGLGGMAAGAFVVAASPHVVVFAAGLFLLSLSKLVFDIGQGSWIADHVPFARRGRVVGLTETSWALGLLVGVSAMALVTAAASWAWGYAVGGLAVAAAAIVLWLQVPPDTPARTTATRSSPGPPAAAGLGSAGWLAVLAVTALVMATQVVFVTFGAWLDEDRGLTTAALAGVTFGLGGLELTASGLSTARTDRWGKERCVIMGATAMVAAAATFLVLGGPLPAALVLLGLFIAAFEFALVSAIPIATTLVPGRPAAGLGRYFTAMTIGRTVTTIPATMLLEHRGFSWCMAVGGALAVAVAALMTARRRLVTPPSGGRDTHRGAWSLPIPPADTTDHPR
jgi:predicted MFS family arabinose efflux permease